MKNGTKNGTRRTTLTLPVKALSAAERIARARKVTLSVVVSEALEKNLHTEAEAKSEIERRMRALEAGRRAFAGLTDEEMFLLDGVIMEPTDE
jgi:predicted transcriptional regulator